MLRWFRRHAKILMVVLGSAAMAIFGLGPVFDTLASRGSRDDSREKEIIATWKGGEITRVDLDQMEMRHYQSQRFLSEVYKEAEKKKKGEGVNSLALPISPIQDGKREMIDDQLITRFLMAERAKEEGMIVSDGMVNDYIAMFSGDAGFSKRDLEAINDTANNRYCSLQAVRERLKTELMANQMQLCTMTAVPIVPNPVEAMELYGRTMEQIECEALPIEVEKYIGKVTGEPTPAEVKKLYEEGKYQFPDPTGERPGFKIGRKLNLQYFVADYETYLQNEMNKLSDEEVQKEYDRLVAAENELVMEPIPVDDGSIEVKTPPPADGDVAPPPTETKTDGADAGNAPADVTPPPADVSAPPAESAKGDQSEESSEAKKDDDQSSFSIQSSKYQFVSTSIQENQDETATKKPDPADESSTQTETAVTAPQESAEKETTEGDAEKKQQEDEPGGIGEITAADAENAQDEKDKIKRRPKPLKDVVEDVKRAMCEDATNKALETALTKAEVMVQDHFQKRMQWEYDDQKNTDTEPEPLDYKAIAKKYNLIAKETGLVDDFEINNDPIGQVRVFMQIVRQGRQVPQLVPVGQLVFNDFSEMRLYDAKTVSDTWGTKNSYLFWAAKKTNTRLPSLDEARPEIEKFWRSKKALELALEEAETIKQKINDVRNKPMSEMYAGRAFSTGAFTWFSSFGSTRYATPIGVKNAGDEFMQTAFSLAKLEAGVATNESKDTVYVIQAIKESKGVEDIGNDYLENQFFKYKRIPNEVLRVSQLYFQELNLNWNQEFQDTMGLKFLDR